MSAGAEPTFVASATRAQPAAADTKPAATTGRRPIRSIARPAGTAASAEATRKIAGPRPSRPWIPVTSTNVIDETAATSCSTAEWTAIVAARMSVLRRTLSCVATRTVKRPIQPRTSPDPARRSFASSGSALAAMNPIPSRRATSTRMPMPMTRIPP